MKFNFKIVNEQKIVRAFLEAPLIVNKRISKAVKRVGIFTQGEVKKTITSGTGMWKSPIDTGQMRQGIGVKSSGMKAIISPSPITDYAVFVHEGTKFMQARPFFDITVKNKQKDIEKFLNKELDKAIKDVARKAK